MSTGAVTERAREVVGLVGTAGFVSGGSVGKTWLCRGRGEEERRGKGGGADPSLEKREAAVLKFPAAMTVLQESGVGSTAAWAPRKRRERRSSERKTSAGSMVVDCSCL